MQAAGDEPAAFSSAEGETAEPEAPAEEAPPYHFALFPSVEEQVENIAEAQAEEARPAAQQTELSMPENRVPEAVIGRALTAGGNEPHSIERIVAHFQKFQSPGDTVRFLALLYGWWVNLLLLGEEGEPKEQGESHLPLFPQTPITLSDFLPVCERRSK